MGWRRSAGSECGSAGGEPRAALRWYGFSFSEDYGGAYHAPAYLREAAIHEALGQTEQAAERYARLIDLWQDADPLLQPRVEQAPARLSRMALTARTRPVRY